ncbi:D-alanyl-D-alanine carboxypeptidase [Streptomyces sp. enrichment culture]|uniref:D-alanyl-D-alanine carboxypeptidase n=1 Tax=Streptomyces sp. enrichment culture TaxID=1795815 RepID=UPI003F572FEC
MAGESPDRSKQRESSAEPTSGSANPVPEARKEADDPRLAVARASAKAPASDTATKILSVPTTDAPTDTDPDTEDDARLRAAVAAWVTDADEKPEMAAAEAEEAVAEAERAEAEEASEAAEEPSDEATEPKDEDEDEAETDAEEAAEGEAEAEEAPEPEDADGEAPEGETEAEQAPEPEAADGKAPEGEAADGKASEGEAEAEQEAPEPEAADGEEDPQGPPAPDDETRTGGAGGNDDPAEGEAEAEQKPLTPEATGVDQPTAVFKAVRPRRDVDQPTTMLKLGDTAPKPDPERTSKFVALKPADPPPPAQQERTTQQPLPPKPPLDLLAELTNTPPPPQTPLRTAARRIKIWTPLVLLLAIVFAVVQSLRPLPAPELTLTAKDSHSFAGDLQGLPWPQEGQAAMDVQGIGTFGSSGEQKPVPIASVAKVMTAYLILRDHPLKSGEQGPKIKIDQAAEEQSHAEGESTVQVTAGDEITQREALQAILIASANNVARLTARWDAGTEKAFVAKMNAAAEDLGMTNTTYTDPSGLNDTTVSTAVDQVKLAKEAMKYPVFREVSAMMEYYDYKGKKWPNWNQLVGKNDVVGIKTGTTTSARGNLVFAAKKEVGGETHTIVGAVLRQPEGGYDNTILQGALSAGDKLIRAAQDRLESVTILKKGEVVGYVDDGLGGRTPVVVTEDVTAVGWPGLEVELNFASDDLPHSAKAGTKVGTLTVGDGGTAGAVKVPVALQSDLVEPGWTDKLTRIS